ncbi:hypothetical protein GCM10027050_08650 [Psychrosphaera aestuarii]
MMWPRRLSFSIDKVPSAEAPKSGNSLSEVIECADAAISENEAARLSVNVNFLNREKRGGIGNTVILLFD